MFFLSPKAFFASVIVASTTFAATTATASPLDACKNAEILLADDTLRHAGGAFGESACYRLEIDEAGLLLLDTAAHEPVRLDLHAHRGLEVLARGASEFLVDARPGVYTLAVHAEDPTRSLPAHRVSSRLLPVSKSETNGELELEPEKSETNGELELEPEKSETNGELELEPEKSETNGELELEPEKFAALPSPFACGLISKSETNGELELEPEKSETNGELELEPEKSETNGELELEPEKANACADIRPLIERLCRRGFEDGDDHGDSLSCASALDSEIHGAIQNGWGDDTDVFRFELSSWQTVEITAAGDITPSVTLHDGRGQTLGAGDDGRLVRTLGPGHYFLRLDSQFETGAYRLGIRSIDQ